jgi:hypothetical protein
MPGHQFENPDPYLGDNCEVVSDSGGPCGAPAAGRVPCEQCGHWLYACAEHKKVKYPTPTRVGRCCLGP